MELFTGRCVSSYSGKRMLDIFGRPEGVLPQMWKRAERTGKLLLPVRSSDVRHGEI
jgi:hypothetical protein